MLQPPSTARPLITRRYVRDILEKTPKSLESVTIEPNGRWSTKAYGQEKSQPSKPASFDDDDDDEIEVSEVTVVGGKRADPSKTSASSISTPTSGNRRDLSASASAPRGLGSTSGKRPAAAVIDLTLSSDDEDDQPIQRPAKRQNTGNNHFNGYRDSESLGFLSESPVGYHN